MEDKAIIVYDKLETSFDHFGLAVIQQALDPGPRIFERLNGEYVCSFRMPFSDEAMPYVQEENILKVNEQLFVIREIGEARDTEGRLVADVFAEHIFSELVTEFVPVIEMEGALPQVILNAILDGTRFTADASALTGLYDFVVERKFVVAALADFIKLTGAEMKRDNFLITFKPQIGEDNGVRISYRKNLKSIKRTTDSRGIVTRLFVFGRDGAYIPPIDSPNIDLYPRPKAGTVTFDDLEDEEDLFNFGTAHLATIDKPIVSYAADVQELKAAEGYDDSEAFALGDTVHADDEDLGIEIITRIVEYEELPWEPSQSKVTLANVKPGLTDLNIRTQQAAQTVERVTRGGKLNTYWLDGVIDALKNQIRASGHYANAQVIQNQGFLLENNDESSPDYGALYIGPGWFMIANSKVSGEWDWRTFGTGAGFTADEINAGTIVGINIQGVNINGSTVTGSTIQTAPPGEYPRVELSLGNFLKAMLSATNYTEITPSFLGAPALHSNDGFTEGAVFTFTAFGQEYTVFSTKDIGLRPGSGRFIRIPSWSTLLNEAGTVTLQNALDSKASAFSGYTGSFSTGTQTVNVVNGVITSVV